MNLNHAPVPPLRWRAFRFRRKRTSLKSEERPIHVLSSILILAALKPPVQKYDLWHDRAVFHFLTTSQERSAYISILMRALKPDAHVIIATFADDGPLQCSGLPVMRYSPSELHAELGSAFTLLKHEREEHQTPSGAAQKFIYCHFQRI